MIRKIVFVVFFFIILNELYSQKITGKVVDESGKNLVYGIIKIKEEFNEDLSEYTIIRNGKYEILLKKKYNKFIIEVVADGFITSKPYIIKKPFKDFYQINFTVKEKDVNLLEEIVITSKNKKFTIKKDTVTYNVSAYKDGSEVKVKDLLKKLPNVQVNEETGEIKYKGQSIKTVLLEGDNLFDYNYSIGTKNININMVEQIQAIENYTENPLLKGISNDKNVALNLKLKKGVIDLSGEVNLGVGNLSDKEDQLYNLNANVIGITKNYKSFGTASFNNIGVNYSSFDYFSFSKNTEQLKEEFFYGGKLIPEIISNNALDEKRINDNNQYFGNYNSIFRVTEKFKIKVNLYYLNDRLRGNQVTENSFIINEQVFTTSDNLSFNKKPTQYRGDLDFKYNVSKSSLLEYNVRLRQEKIVTSTSIISNAVNGFDTDLNSKDFFFKQKLTYTHKISPQKAIQLSFNNSYNKTPQNLSIIPLVNNNFNFINQNQKSEIKKNFSEVKADLLGNTSSKKYSLTVGGILTRSNLSSNLLESDLKNDVFYYEKSIYQLGTIELNYNRWSFKPSYSFRYLDRKIDDLIELETFSKVNYLFEPSLNIRYILSNSSFLNSRISYNINSDADNFLFSNGILINNRSIKSSNPNLGLKKIFNYGLSFYKNNLYNQFQINLGLNYQNIKGDFLANFNIDENFSNINYFYTNAKASSISSNFLIAKYIPLIEANAKIELNYSESRYVNIVNASSFRNNKNRFYSGSLSFNTAFNGSVNIENTTNLSKSISTNNDNSQNFTNEAFGNSFSVKCNFSKKWFAKLIHQYYLPNTNRLSENFTFLDFSLRHRPKNKKFEYNLLVTNISNIRNFNQIRTTDFSTDRNSVQILNRYYLINLTYTF